MPNERELWTIQARIDAARDLLRPAHELAERGQRSEELSSLLTEVRGKLDYAMRETNRELERLG